MLNIVLSDGIAKMITINIADARSANNNILFLKGCV